MKRSVFLLAAALALAVVGVTAQAPKAFEVASVKASAPNPAGIMSGIPRVVPGNGRLTATNIPLRLLIRIAFEVQDFQISGGPSELMTSKFDITAKAEDGATPTTKETLGLLRILLADRFNLKTHTEPRESPIYALVLARSDGKLGPDLKPSASDCVGKEAETQKRIQRDLICLPISDVPGQWARNPKRVSTPFDPEYGEFSLHYSYNYPELLKVLN